MLNPFPALLDYWFLAPTILRISAGIVFIALARRYWIRLGGLQEFFASRIGAPLGKACASLYVLVFIAVGIGLTIGLYTQIAAIAGTLIGLIMATNGKILAPYGRAVGWLLFVISLSLLITGAGAFAFDIPL